MVVGATAMGPCPREREKRLNSDFNKYKWGFITKVRGKPPIYIRCRQILFDSTYMRYLE